MSLSSRAEGIIRALVTSGISFANHIAQSTHFDEPTAWQSVAQYQHGARGVSNCGYFAYDVSDDSGPEIYRIPSNKIVNPGKFTGIVDGWNLSGTPLKNAKSAHDEAERKFNYKTRKNVVRSEVEDDLYKSWQAYKDIDRHALIKAFLLQKKSDLSSRDENDNIVSIFGYIPYGYIGYIIPAGARRHNYDQTSIMKVVVRGGANGGNPQVINAYPVYERAHE